MSQKIGFWAVFAIVTGSQIGATIFMSPTSLAQYGIFSLIGWMISGAGALSLCFIFAFLCNLLPHNGGPAAYIKYAFGKHAAFFVGWTYWVVSWVSTSVVVIAAIGSLSPFFGSYFKIVEFPLQIILLFLITLLNLKGVHAAGKIEFFLTLMKFIPLIIIPLAALPHFNIENFTIAEHIKILPKSKILEQTTILTFFGFIGLECATAPAGSIKNPSKIIPKAIIFGTFAVVLLYFLNSFAIMGIIPESILVNSPAPYVDATKKIFGGNWHLLISIIASIVCIGTLNAWILTSGQISLGLAEDGLMPNIFKKKNKNDAPYISIIISSIGMIPFLILTQNDNISTQINKIIDFSVTAFIFVYLACCLAFMKIQFKYFKNSSNYIKNTNKIITYSKNTNNKDENEKYTDNICTKENFNINRTTKILRIFYGSFAISFCCWIFYETNIESILYSCIFIASGIPIYILKIRKES